MGSDEPVEGPTDNTDTAVSNLKRISLRVAETDDSNIEGWMLHFPNDPSDMSQSCPPTQLLPHYKPFSRAESSTLHSQTYQRTAPGRSAIRLTR